MTFTHVGHECQDLFLLCSILRCILLLQEVALHQSSSVLRPVQFLFMSFPDDPHCHPFNNVLVLPQIFHPVSTILRFQWSIHCHSFWHIHFTFVTYSTLSITGYLPNDGISDCGGFFFFFLVVRIIWVHATDCMHVQTRHLELSSKRTAGSGVRICFLWTMPSHWSNDEGPAWNVGGPSFEWIRKKMYLKGSSCCGSCHAIYLGLRGQG